MTCSQALRPALSVCALRYNYLSGSGGPFYYLFRLVVSTCPWESAIVFLRRPLFLAVLAALFVVTACEGTSGSEETTTRNAVFEEAMTEQAQREELAQEYRDDGYTVTTNESVALRFVTGEPSAPSCPYSSGSCSILEVIALRRCESLTVWVQFKNGSGVVVDDTLDRVSRLDEGERAYLEFSSFHSQADRTSLDRVQCSLI